MDESNPLEEIKTWEHPPRYGSDQFKEKVALIFWRIRRVSSTTSRLVSGCRWSDNWFLIHVRKLRVPPSRYTLSQTLLAERRIIPYSTEIHWCIQNYSYEFGCQTRETHRWLLEYRWIKRLVWSVDRFHSDYSIGRKTSKRIYVARGEIKEKTADVQARSFMARSLDKNLEGKPSWRRCANCRMKNRNLMMPEDYEESVSLTLRTRNSKKPLRRLARNWKRRWLLLCLARQARNVSMERPVAKAMSSHQNLRVFWKSVNPQDCVWQNHCRLTMKTILQE